MTAILLFVSVVATVFAMPDRFADQNTTEHRIRTILAFTFGPLVLLCAVILWMEA